MRTPVQAMRRLIRTKLTRTLTCSVISIFLFAGFAGQGPDSKPKQAGSPPAANTQAGPKHIQPLQFDTNALLHHLNQVISWYRHATTGVSSVGLPSDTIYQDNTKTLGAQIVKLAFQSAKAEAALIRNQQKTTDATQPGSTQEQTLAQAQVRVSGQIDQIQSQIAQVTAKLSGARASQRKSLLAQREALQSELDLQKALLEAIQKMVAFIENNGEAGTGVQGAITQLERSIPEVMGPQITPEKPVTSPTAPAKPTLANSGGLISDAVTLYDYMTAVHQIDGVIKETAYAREAAEHLRTPIRDALRAAISQSQQLANQPPSNDPEQLQSEQATFQEITDRFKQLSGVLMPLSQELIVLNDAKTNFEEWRSSIARESRHVLRSVLLRVGGILIALAFILVLSEVWRRVTFKYIGDPRRRRQFLVLRRVVIGFLIVIVLLLGFVSEFSSLATFAGFITAGIAVGLQAVLLSVAAYFFIIGRYGIRVGDRISVAGITGDVVDIGLVRFYLMEIAGTGLDFYPTGRLVVFSNSVLFQTGTPLFKQIPGTEYAWHEIVMMIAPSGNHKAAQQKLLAAVDEVYSKYRQEIERQHSNIERRVDILIETPRPEARLQFAEGGLELLVRYPVEIRRAPDIDEEMTRTVLRLVESDGELKTAVSGTPKIRSAIKG